MQAAVLNGIKGIQHDFGSYAEPKSLFVRQKWSERVKKTQIHGTKIIAVTHSNNDFVDADGLYTTTKNLLLPVVNADCYPLLFSRKDGNAIAALHVGWRGALEGIIFKFRDLLESHNDDIADWIVAIGPGAKPCCYQVSEEIINEFYIKYSLNEKDICPQFRMIDLSVIIIHQLKSIGLPLFEDISSCTICSSEKKSNEAFSPKFYSYRRDGNKDVQVSAIMMT